MIGLRAAKFEEFLSLESQKHPTLLSEQVMLDHLHILVSLDDGTHIESILDAILSILVEYHEFLLLSRHGAEEAGPEADSHRLISREDELLILE